MMGEPLPPFNTRYPNVLESILESAKLKSDLLSHNVIQTAVCYYVQLAKSQAFLNGNKRMSVIFTDMFLTLNGYTINRSIIDLADLTLILSEDHVTSLEKTTELVLPLFRAIATVINP